MRQLDITEIKKIELEILDEVHSFCISHGITYSLCGGSLLGAVRHKGYIPWDDDIDMFMPRNDYERFKAEYRSDKNEVIDLSTIESCEEQFLKVSRKGTIMEDVILHRRLWGVNVDVFPVDGMPEDYKTYTDKLCKIHSSIVEACPLYKSARKKKLYWALRYYLKRITKGFHGNVLFLKQELNQLAKEHLPEHSPLATVIYGDFKIFPYPSYMFFEIKDIEFEGKHYKCVSDTHLFLSTLYGDYMTLPPEEKRVSHHLYDSYIDE